MKTNFRKLAAIVLACASVLAVSCKEDEEVVVTPVFPNDLGTIEVEPGDTVTLTITANLDWELSLEADEGTNWFWFLKGSQPVTSLSGEATTGTTVTVHVSEEEEFDNDRYAYVNMTMGGTTKTIATYLRAAEERHFELYLGTYSDDSFLDEYSSYAAEENASIELVWPEKEKTYAMPVQVVANFEWEVTDCPDWIDLSDLSNDSRVGTVEFCLQGNPAKYNLSGEKASITFGNSAETASFSYTVVLPECASTMRSTFPESANFDAKGNYGSGEVLSRTITSAKGIEVIAVTKINSWMYPQDDYFFTWCTIDTPNGAWDNDKEALIQTVTYSISLEENTSTSGRSCQVLAIPASKLSDNFDPSYDLFNNGGTEIKEDYKQYIITNITQDGASPAFFTKSQYEDCTFTTMSSSNDYYNELVEVCSDLYTLTFAASSNAYVGLEPTSLPYDYKIFDTSGAEISNDNPFVSVSCNDWGGGELSVELSIIGGNLSGDKDEAFVLFYNDSGECLAIVYCVYDPSGSSGDPGSAPFSFLYPDYVSGATLLKYEGDVSEYTQAGAKADEIYELTYTTKQPTMAYVKLPISNPNCIVWNNGDDSWLSYEFYDSDVIIVSMNASEYISGPLMMRSADWTSVYFLICTYNPQ